MTNPVHQSQTLETSTTSEVSAVHHPGRNSTLLALVTEAQLDLAANRSFIEELVKQFNQLNPIQVVSDPSTEIISIPEGAIQLAEVTTNSLFDNGLGQAIFELMATVKPGDIVGVATETPDVFGDEKLGTFASWNVVGKTPDGDLVIEVATQTVHASHQRLLEEGYDKINPQFFGPDIIRFAIDPQNPRFDGTELMWPRQYDRSGNNIGWNPQLSSAVYGEEVRRALQRIGYPSSE
jgi:hypothetical protein